MTEIRASPPTKRDLCPFGLTQTLRVTAANVKQRLSTAPRHGHPELAIDRISGVVVFDALARLDRGDATPAPSALELIMHKSVFARLRTSCLLFASAALALFFMGATHAAAFGGVLGDWQGFYRPPSTSGDAAACQLCHVETNGGEPFNAYGWAILEALEDDFCDLSEPPDGVDNVEAFLCVELEDSDSDPTASDNLTEIDASTQPGWTHGESNT